MRPSFESRVFAQLPATTQDIAKRTGLIERSVLRVLERMHKAGDAHITTYVEGEPNAAGVVRWRPLWARGGGTNAIRPANPIARIGRPAKTKQDTAADALTHFFATMEGRNGE